MTAYNTTYFNGNFNNGLYAYHNSAVSEFISVSDNVKTQIIDIAANIGSATLNTFTSGTFTCNDPGTYLVEFGLEAGPSNFTASDLISTKIFIEDEDNSNLATSPSAKDKKIETGKNLVSNKSLSSAPEAKKSSGKKFINDLKNSNLASAPSAKIKSASEFIDDLKNQNLALKENQKNSHIEKAPKAKSEKPKKFMEDEEDANLAEAPGNHKKDGKEFVEDINRANLSSAPKAKKK